MLVRGKLLDAAVATVMVGHQQSFVGDHLTGAASAEDDDSVLERRMVDTVDLVRGEPATEILHRVRIEFLEERKHPHPLVCHRAEPYHKGGRDGTNQFSHIKYF